MVWIWNFEGPGVISGVLRSVGYCYHEVILIWTVESVRFACPFLENRVGDGGGGGAKKILFGTFLVVSATYILGVLIIE